MFSSATPNTAQLVVISGREDPQQAVQRRAGFAQQHFGKLHDDGDNQNKSQRAQIDEIERD